MIDMRDLIPYLVGAYNASKNVGDSSKFYDDYAFVCPLPCYGLSCDVEPVKINRNLYTLKISHKDDDSGKFNAFLLKGGMLLRKLDKQDLPGIVVYSYGEGEKGEDVRLEDSVVAFKAKDLDRILVTVRGKDLGEELTKLSKSELSDVKRYIEGLERNADLFFGRIKDGKIELHNGMRSLAVVNYSDDLEVFKERLQVELEKRGESVDEEDLFGLIRFLYQHNLKGKHGGE